MKTFLATRNNTKPNAINPIKIFLFNLIQFLKMKYMLGDLSLVYQISS